MNKILNGKRYDTSTAILYGSAKVKINRIPCTLSLYRKRGGSYFLASGADDPYYLKPLSPRQARVWAYRHLPIDDYEQHFGGAILQASGKQSQLLSLKSSTIEKLRLSAAIQNTTMSDIVDQLVDLVVDVNGGYSDGEENE